MLDWDGKGTICWDEDDSYCVTYNICPSEEPEFTFDLLDEIGCPPLEDPNDAFDTLLDWFGAEFGFSSFE